VIAVAGFVVLALREGRDPLLSEGPDVG